MGRESTDVEVKSNRPPAKHNLHLIGIKLAYALYLPLVKRFSYIFICKGLSDKVLCKCTKTWQLAKMYRVPILSMFPSTSVKSADSTNVNEVNMNEVNVE